MIFSNPYKEDIKSFTQIIKEKIEYYDFYSGGQLEKIEQELKSTQEVIMLISKVLTDEQKKEIAENLNYFPKV